MVRIQGNFHGCFSGTIVLVRPQALHHILHYRKPDIRSVNCVSQLVKILVEIALQAKMKNSDSNQCGGSQFQVIHGVKFINEFILQ